MKKITATVKDTLNLARGEKDRRSGARVHHASHACRPAFLDARSIPMIGGIGWCYLGNPETVNTGPVGLGRFSTLRSWLSQWSIDDTNADGLRWRAKISVPCS